MVSALFHLIQQIVVELGHRLYDRCWVLIQKNTFCALLLFQLTGRDKQVNRFMIYYVYKYKYKMQLECQGGSSYIYWFRVLVLRVRVSKGRFHTSQNHSQWMWCFHSEYIDLNLPALLSGLLKKIPLSFLNQVPFYQNYYNTANMVLNSIFSLVKKNI